MHRLRDAEIPHRRHLTAQPLMLARRSAGGNPRRRISHNGTAPAVRPGNGSSIESALWCRDSQRKITRPTGAPTNCRMPNSAITTMKPAANAAGFVDCVEKRHGTQASGESPPPVPIPAERTCVRCHQVRSGIAPSFSSDYPGRLHPCAVGVHGRFLLVFGQRQCPSELRSASKQPPSCRFPDQIVVRVLKRIEPTTVSRPYSVIASSARIAGNYCPRIATSHRQPAHRKRR